ncbi:hypothetical protein BC629DRAFT_1588479 [Irpex lacteus]|nr:hypothetical protein BC629DRAFT_1588479 [Irpex lacteus]
MSSSVSRGFKPYDVLMLDIKVNNETPTASHANPNHRLELILKFIKQNEFKSLGHFLIELFSIASDRNEDKPQVVTQTVASFLNGKSTKYNSSTPNSEKNRPPQEIMAKHMLEQWALTVVERMVDSEAEELVSPESELRLVPNVTWDFALGFSFQRVFDVAHSVAPNIMRLLEAVALPSHKRRSRSTTRTESTSDNASSSISRDQIPPAFEIALIPAGQGQNRRDPLMIITVALMMILNARNLRFTVFQKLIGVWLFANSAA